MKNKFTKKIKLVNYKEFSKIKEKRNTLEKQQTRKKSAPKNNIQTPSFQILPQEGISKMRVIQDSYIRIPYQFQNYPPDDEYEPDEEDLLFLKECNDQGIKITESDFTEQIINLEYTTETIHYKITAMEPGRLFSNESKYIEEIYQDYGVVAQYYQEKRTKLMRPLLRVFMRGIKDDAQQSTNLRCIQTMKYIKDYKKNSLKEVKKTRKYWNKNESKLTELMKSVLVREQAKQYSILLDKAMWQIQQEQGLSVHKIKNDFSTFLPELESQLSKNSQSLKEQTQQTQDDLVCKLDKLPSLVCKLDQCPSRSLLTQTDMQQFDIELFKFFEGELADIRSRGIRILWPQRITSIRSSNNFGRDLNSEQNKKYSLVIDEWNTLGIYVDTQNFTLGTPEKTINISMIDRNPKPSYKFTLRNHLKRSSEIVINDNFDFLHLRKHAKAALQNQRSAFVRTIQNIRRKQQTKKLEPKDLLKVVIDEICTSSSSESLELFEKDDDEFFINLNEDQEDCLVVLDF